MIASVSLRIVVFALLCLQCRISLLASEQPFTPLKSTEEWVELLGSQEFKVREEATRILMANDCAGPALRNGLTSTDAEVRRRAAEILGGLARRQLVALAHNGELELLVEVFVRKQGRQQDEQCWQVVAELAGRLVDREKEELQDTRLITEPEMPLRDFQRYAKTRRLEMIVASQYSIRGEGVAHVVRAEEVFVQTPRAFALIASAGSIIVSGPPKLPVSIHSSVMFAGGNVELKTGIHECVILCGGDLSAPHGMRNCLVICRGAVDCAVAIGNCVVVTGGKVTLAPKARVVNSRIEENQRSPLGIVKWFDPGRAGIDVELTDGALRVKHVEKKRPFAKAGVKSGDVLVAIDGTEVNALEAFRRLLLRKVAEEAEPVVRVRRGERTVDIPVSLAGLLLMGDSAPRE